MTNTSNVELIAVQTKLIAKKNTEIVTPMSNATTFFSIFFGFSQYWTYIILTFVSQWAPRYTSSPTNLTATAINQSNVPHCNLVHCDVYTYRIPKTEFHGHNKMIFKIEGIKIPNVFCSFLKIIIFIRRFMSTFSFVNSYLEIRKSKTRCCLSLHHHQLHF